MHQREERAPLQTSTFHMADVRRKRATARRAVAVGELYAGSAFDDIVAKRLPKGDAIAMAEIAGLQGAKNAAQLMPLCHPLPLEYLELRCEPVAERKAIRVYCEVATHARTGVEMEALAGVNAALLTLYDLTKPVQPALAIGGIRLLFKEGGKKGLWLHPDGLSDAERAHYRPRATPRLEGVPAAVITLSDRAHRGEYEDVSGPLLVERLRALGAELGPAEVRADEVQPLAARLRELAAAGVRLVLCTGGTGLGPRDVTPEALAQVAERHVPGIAEMFRSESSQHTPLAWLSRATAVLVGDTLVIALPGSAKAVAQGMDILAPILAHALAMVAGEGHA
jgi:cyclic pyranopterin monophosphate synthase